MNRVAIIMAAGMLVGLTISFSLLVLLSGQPFLAGGVGAVATWATDEWLERRTR